MTQPYPEEIAAAKAQPGGWVYRIAGGFGADEAVPPEAVVGAWKVDDDGAISGDFIPNERHDAMRYPV